MVKLRTTRSQPRHDGAVSLTWSGPGFVSAGDDRVIGRWSSDGEWNGQMASVAEYGVIDVHSCAAAGDTVACACSDGCVRLLTPNGKEDKKIAASSSGAAITSVRWAYDGSAFATASEDGTVKVWSRSGMLRTTLATAPRCVYALRWGADNNTILYACGSELFIASVQGDAGGTLAKAARWKAHDGVVLVCDWSPVHGRIVSGGEDGRYRVWDTAGRLLFSSSPAEQPITSVCWSPSGAEFSVGGFRSLRLCHSSGWCQVREGVPGGGVASLAWAPDGTAFAASASDGSVTFCSVLDRTDVHGSVSVRQSEPNRLVIRDCAPPSGGLAGGLGPAGQQGPPAAPTQDEVAFRDRVTSFVLTEGHVVALTPSQAHILGRGAWHSPRAIDLRSPAAVLVASTRSFLVVDGAGSGQVYGYDGRASGAFKLPGLRPELTPPALLSLSPDSLGYLDRTDDRTVRVLDLRTGRQVGSGPYVHPTPITALALSQGTLGGLADRCIAVLDASNALYLVRPSRTSAAASAAAASGAAGGASAAWTATKLAAVCDGFLWADGTDCLVALVDGDLTAWLAASGMDGDAELCEQARAAAPGAGAALGAMPTLLHCTAGRVSAQRADGTHVHLTAPGGPMVPLLYEAVAGGRWDEAVRLCRFARSPPMWAALACWALGGSGRHLDSAVAALAALGAVDRLEWVSHVKARPLPEERAAEMAVYRHAADEGEAILLQAGLRMRAIKLNLRLGRWLRALELGAKTGRLHWETVLAYRQRYLATMAGHGRPPAAETLEPFGAAMASLQQPLNWAGLKAARKAEKDREAQAALQAAAGAGGGRGMMLGGGPNGMPAAGLRSPQMGMGRASDSKD